MVFYDRYQSFNKRISNEDLIEWVEDNSTSDVVGFHYLINLLINIGVPIYLFCFAKVSLLEIAIAFVLTDIILVFINYIFFYFIPYKKTMRLSLDGVQKRIDKMSIEKDKLEKYLLKSSNRYSDSYRDYSNDITKLNRFISVEQQYLKTEYEKIAKEEIKKDVRVSKDFEDKQEYFQRCGERLRYYINDYKMDVLSPVLQSVMKLKNILKQKPSGMEIVPNTLYIYLDELLNVADSLTRLDDEQKAKYKEDVEKVSLGIRTTIANLIDRINRLETNDIEVSLNVLMQELKKEQNGDVVDKVFPEKQQTVVHKTKHTPKNRGGTT